MEGLRVSRQIQVPIPIPNKGYIEVAGDKVLPEGALSSLINGISTASGVIPLPMPVEIASEQNSRWWVGRFGQASFFFCITPTQIKIYTFHQSDEDEPNYKPFYLVQTITVSFNASLNDLTVLRQGNSLVLFFSGTSKIYKLTFTQGAFALTQHDLPFIAKHICSLNEWRLLFANIYEDGRWYESRVRWTQFNSFEVDPLDFIDLPEHYPIIGMTSFEGQVVIFRDNGIDLLQPTGDELFPFRVVPSVRHISFRTPIDVSVQENALYVLDADMRLYRTDGRQLEFVSVTVTPQLRGQNSPEDRPTKIVSAEVFNQLWLMAAGSDKTLGFSVADETFYETDKLQDASEWRRGTNSAVVENKWFMVCAEVQEPCDQVLVRCSDAYFVSRTLDDFGRRFTVPSVSDAAKVYLPNQWQVIAIGKSLYLFPAPNRLTRQFSLSYPFSDFQAPNIGKQVLWLTLRFVKLNDFNAHDTVTLKITSRFYLPKFHTQEQEIKSELEFPLPTNDEVRLPLRLFGQKFKVELVVPANCPVRFEGGTISLAPFGNLW